MCVCDCECGSCKNANSISVSCKRVRKKRHTQKVSRDVPKIFFFFINANRKNFMSNFDLHADF